MIKFWNIRTKEIVECDTEPKISAFWASSDRSPNVTQGQDFGWRLAPDVVVWMKKIKTEPQTLETIARRGNILLEEVGEKEILEYISFMTPSDDATVAEDGDYSEEYETAIRNLEGNSLPAAPEKTIEELEAELEAAKAKAKATTKKPKDK